MILRESITIAASAEAVWLFVADPVLQSQWNPKIISIDRQGSGPVHFQERFSELHRMSGREDLSLVEVTECDPFEHVVFTHRTTFKGKESWAIEAYAIKAHGDGVKVIQTIDLTRAQIPLVFRLLIWLISRFGTPSETPYLQRLKTLVETKKSVE